MHPKEKVTATGASKSLRRKVICHLKKSSEVGLVFTWGKCHATAKCKTTNGLTTIRIFQTCRSDNWKFINWFWGRSRIASNWMYFCYLGHGPYCEKCFGGSHLIRRGQKWTMVVSKTFKELSAILTRVITVKLSYNELKEWHKS